MKERPILFSGPMVRAILAVTKTQTRRVIKPGRKQDWLSPSTLLKSPGAYPVIICDEQWAQFYHPLAGKTYMGVYNELDSPLACIKHPYGKPGDRLWVRETWQKCTGCNGGDGVLFRADCEHVPAHPWRPSIFMPRKYSRITLEITGVRVERLQNISREDAIAEGIQVLPLQSADDPSAWWQSAPGAHQERTPVASFHALWDSINAKKHPWTSNPFVWVISFQRID